MKTFALTVWTLSFIFFGQACDSKPSQDQEDVVAKVGGQKIFAKELEAKLQGLPPQPNQEDKGTFMEEQKKQALDSLINEAVVFEAALKDDILEKSPRLRREIAREYMQQELGAKKEQPTEKELEAFFEEKKDGLERIRVSHILIAPSDKLTEADARKKAENLLAKLKTKDGESKFSEFAKELSDDPRSKNRGGDIFFIKRDQMDPAFTQAAFALEKVGDISDIVKTKEGFHIIKLTGEQRGFKFFQHSLKWELAQAKEKEHRDAFFLKLRNKASIKVDEKAVAKVGQK